MRFDYDVGLSPATTLPSTHASKSTKKNFPEISSSFGGAVRDRTQRERKRFSYKAFRRRHHGGTTQRNANLRVERYAAAEQE